MTNKLTLHYTFQLDDYNNGNNNKIQICIAAKSEREARKKLTIALGKHVVENLVKDYAERY